MSTDEEKVASLRSLMDALVKHRIFSKKDADTISSYGPLLVKLSKPKKEEEPSEDNDRTR